MNYEQAVSYVLGLTDLEREAFRSPEHFDLRRMEELMALTGNPQSGTKAVHVAGTKGKGSTSAMIASALTASGFRTGLYTSPHLHSMRERIQIDNKHISEAEFASLVEVLRPTLENHPTSSGFRSTFEVLTALAFLYFRQRKADYQVLETGLGGRLDATNVVRPLVSVITSISFDHTDVLGDTMAQIAGEKAGIIKPGVPVVTSPQPTEAAQVLRRVAQEKGAKLVEVGEDVTWQGLKADLKGQRFIVKGEKGEYDLFIPLLGDFQLENAATAVAALEQLSEPRITPQSIALGFSRVSWPGRLQVLGARPLLVVDGAHNEYSVACLREAVNKYFTFNRLFLIFGLSIDKEATGMIKELAPLKPEVILATSQHPRAMPAASMVKSWREQGFEPAVYPDVPQALVQAQARAEEGDLILATGSLFIVAEVMEYVARQKQKGKP